MKLIKDGNFSPWFRRFLSFGGLFIMYTSYHFLTNIWMYSELTIGLVIGSIGAYAGNAQILKLKPFDNSYKKARESYEKDDAKS